MATTRRKSTGFSDLVEKLEEVEETSSPLEVLDLLQEVVEEEAETTQQPEVVKAVPPKPFVEERIVPTEDSGPRFVENLPPVPVQKKAEKVEVKPKRHPRNVPRFSRTR
jgi:hypothetical protein